MKQGESQNNFQNEAILGREKLEEKRMKEITEEAITINPYYFNSDWNEFKEDYSRADANVRENMVKARKIWIEMKELGSKYEEFITKSMKESLETGEDRFFSEIVIYESLGYKDSTTFLSHILKSKALITSDSGVYPSHILSYFRSARDKNTIPEIMGYIDKATEPDYGRKEFLNYDIMVALASMDIIVGREKTATLIEELAEQSDGFKQWLITNKIQGDDIFDRISHFHIYSSPLVIDPFESKEAELTKLQELNNIPLPIPHESVRNADNRGYLSSFVSDVHKEERLNERMEQENIASKANDLVQEMIDKREIDERIAPAAKLHLYNVMRTNGGDESWQKEVDKIHRMSEIELKYKEKKDLLPTVGIEIETPEASLNTDKKRILNALRISNVDAVGSLPNRKGWLWEVNPDYSYSPLAQSRVLQELAVMKAIPIDANTGKVPEDIPLSLHINFGFLVMDERRQYDVKKKYDTDIKWLNDILTYGFASTYRIENRKTSNSYKIQPASYADEVKVSDSPYNRALWRLELRSGEFRDYPTFRLLAEAQALTASLMATIKIEEEYFGQDNNRDMRKEDAILASIWPELKAEIQGYLKRYNIFIPNMIDYQRIEIVKIMQIPGFKEGCREIITKYAKMVLKEVFPKDYSQIN